MPGLTLRMVWMRHVQRMPPLTQQASCTTTRMPLALKEYKILGKYFLVRMVVFI